MDAKQVPLRELLASVPADARLVIDDADGKGTRFIPVGRLCQEAAAALAEPQQNTFLGWVFKRNADGSVGIFAPQPKPGESQRTSDCVGPNQRDLNELLGKLADHMAALAEQDDEVCDGLRGGLCIHQDPNQCKPDRDCPAFSAPPQRKPLAEWQINDLMADIDPEDRDSWSFRQGVYAAEKHHGVRK